MGKPDSFMPLYIGDYLRDTQGLTAAEHGAYLLLLMALWIRGGTIPDDPHQLAAIAMLRPQDWKRIGPNLLKRFFERVQVDGGVAITQKRVVAELSRAKELIDQKRRAGIKSGEKRKRAFNMRSTGVEREGQRNGNETPYLHIHTPSLQREVGDALEEHPHTPPTMPSDYAKSKTPPNINPADPEATYHPGPILTREEYAKIISRRENQQRASNPA